LPQCFQHTALNRGLFLLPRAGGCWRHGLIQSTLPFTSVSPIANVILRRSALLLFVGGPQTAPYTEGDSIVDQVVESEIVQKMTKRKMDAVREAERCGHGRRSEVNISRRGAHRRDGIAGSGGEASLPRRQCLSMRLLLRFLCLHLLLRPCAPVRLLPGTSASSPNSDITQVYQICAVAYFVASRQSCLQCTSQVSHIHLCCALSMYRLLFHIFVYFFCIPGLDTARCMSEGEQLCVALMEKGMRLKAETIITPQLCLLGSWMGCGLGTGGQAGHSGALDMGLRGCIRIGLHPPWGSAGSMTGGTVERQRTGLCDTSHDGQLGLPHRGGCEH
jgi:hypothetical protein